MSDIARLGIAVESQQASEAAIDLDKLTQSAERAEDSARDLSMASRQADMANAELAQSTGRVSGAVQQVERAMDMAAAAQGRSTALTHANSAALEANARAARLASFQQRNLSFQLMDVGQSLALGMNPMLVFAQQGSQIAQIYSMEEGGVGRALRESAKMIGGLTLRLAPLGLALGAVGTAFAAVANEANKTSEVSVSAVDVMVATWQSFADWMSQTVAPIMDWISDRWDEATPYIVGGINNIIRAFDTARLDIVDYWNLLPAAIGGTVIGAANATIRGVESMVNGAIGLINEFIAQVRRLNIPGLSWDPIGEVKFGGIDNPWADAARDLEQALAENRLETMGKDYLADIVERARELASASEEVEDKLDGASESAKKLREEVDEAAQQLERTLGSILSNVFTTPLDDWNSLMDTVMRDLASLGQQNLSGLFSGSLTAANDNGMDGIGAAPGFDAIEAFRDGLSDGVREGTFGGLTDFVKSNSGTINAGLGGAGLGYASQDPFMGALGGALQGFAAGGPMGAAIGGLTGLIGGLFGMQEAIAEAREELRKINGDVRDFVKLGMGETVGTYSRALTEFKQQAAEYLELAEKAGNTALANQLRDARGAYRGTLAGQFRDDIGASINSLRGRDWMNDIAAAQDQYNQRLADAEALGIKATGAQREFNLTLAQIANDSDLTKKQLRDLANTFPALAGSIDEVLRSTRIERLQGRLSNARAELIRSYDAERQAVQSTATALESAIENVRQARSSLLLDSQLSALSPRDQYAEARQQFNELAKLARGGDIDAINSIGGAGRDLLDSARGIFGSSEGYADVFNRVQDVLSQVELSAMDQLSDAEQQLKRLDTQVGKLVDIDNSVKSVTRAIRNVRTIMADLRAAQRQENRRAANSNNAASNDNSATAEIRELRKEVRELRQTVAQAGLEQVDATKGTTKAVGGLNKNVGHSRGRNAFTGRTSR